MPEEEDIIIGSDAIITTEKTKEKLIADLGDKAEDYEIVVKEDD